MAQIAFFVSSDSATRITFTEKNATTGAIINNGTLVKSNYKSTFWTYEQTSDNTPDSLIVQDTSATHIYAEPTSTDMKEFVGWFTFDADRSMDGQLPRYTQRRISSNQTISYAEIVANAGRDTRSGNFFVMAGYGTRSVITYNGNGGTPAKSSDSICAGLSVILPSASRSGFSFDGWYDASGNKIGSAGEQYGVSGNATLNAGWKNLNPGSRETVYVSGGGECEITFSGITQGSRSLNVRSPIFHGYCSTSSTASFPDSISYYGNDEFSITVVDGPYTQDFYGWFTFHEDMALVNCMEENAAVLISQDATITRETIQRYAKKDTRTGNYVIFAKFGYSSYFHRINYASTNSGATLSKSYDIYQYWGYVILPSVTHPTLLCTGFYNKGTLVGMPGERVQIRTQADFTIYAYFQEEPQPPGTQTYMYVTSDSPVTLRYQGTHAGTHVLTKHVPLMDTYVTEDWDGNSPNAVMYIQEEGGSLSITAPFESNDGKTFIGWFTYHEDRALFDDLLGLCAVKISTNTTLDRTTIERYAKRDTRSGTYLVVAGYRPRVRLVYNGAGGTSSRANDWVVFGSYVPLPTATRGGFIFGGWWLNTQPISSSRPQTYLGDAGQNYYPLAEHKEYHSDDWISISAQWTMATNGEYMGVQVAMSNNLASLKFCYDPDHQTPTTRRMDRAGIKGGYVSSFGLDYGWDIFNFSTQIHKSWLEVISGDNTTGFYTLPYDMDNPSVANATRKIDTGSLALNQPILWQNLIAAGASRDTMSGNFVIVFKMESTTPKVVVSYDMRFLKPDGSTVQMLVGMQRVVPEGGIVQENIGKGTTPGTLPSEYFYFPSGYDDWTYDETPYLDAACTIKMPSGYIANDDVTLYHRAYPSTVSAEIGSSNSATLYRDTYRSYGWNTLSAITNVYVNNSTYDGRSYGWSSVGRLTGETSFGVDSSTTQYAGIPAGYLFDGWYTMQSDMYFPSKNDVTVKFSEKTELSAFDFYNAKIDTRSGSRVILLGLKSSATAHYNISYNLNGGTASGEYPTTAQWYNPVRLLTPTRAGYRFKGWSFSGDCSTIRSGVDLSPQYRDSSTQSWSFMRMTSSYKYGENRDWFEFKNAAQPIDGRSIVLTANWEIITYSVSFRAEPGQFIDIRQSQTSYYTHEDMTIQYGKSITAPIFKSYANRQQSEIGKFWKRDGFFFRGWSKINGATEPTYVMGREYEYTEFTDNPTLYAVYNGNTLTILFDGNGGIVNGNGYKTMKVGEQIGTLPSVSPSSLFLGWYTAASGGTLVTEQTTFSADSILYAHYKSDTTYTVILNDPSGVNSPHTISCAVGATVQLPTVSSLGWSIRTSKTFDPSSTWTTSQSLDGGKMFADGGTFTNLGDAGQTVNLYLILISNQIVVTFDAQGGTASQQTKTCKRLEAIGSLPTATKDGKTFAGWYTSVSGGSIVTESTTLPNASAITIYARWDDATGGPALYVKYTLNLVTNGGTIAASYGELKYVYGYVKALPTGDQITKSGSTFGGWYTNAQFTGDPVTSVSATDKGKKTFYAKWA